MTETAKSARHAGETMTAQGHWSRRCAHCGIPREIPRNTSHECRAEDIKTFNGLIGLQDRVKRIEKTVGEMAAELRHHRDRIVRLETKCEIDERLLTPKPRCLPPR